MAACDAGAGARRRSASAHAAGGFAAASRAPFASNGKHSNGRALPDGTLPPAVHAHPRGLRLHADSRGRGREPVHLVTSLATICVPSGLRGGLRNRHRPLSRMQLASTGRTSDEMGEWREMKAAFWLCGGGRPYRAGLTHAVLAERRDTGRRPVEQGVPRPQTSVASARSPPRTCSGALQAGVPTPARQRPGGRAMRRSMSFAWSAWQITFDGVRSRCGTRLRCRYANAGHSCTPSARAPRLRADARHGRPSAPASHR